MGDYVLSDGVARTVMWIGVTGYTGSALVYTFKLLFGNIQTTFDNLVKYVILIVGFCILSASTIRKAVTVQKDRKDMEKPEFLFHKFTRMGWACMAFHFISMYVLPHHTYFYYIIALIGYSLLAAGKQLGVYILFTFYAFSNILMYARPVVDYAVAPIKLLNMTYMGAYCYIFARQYFKRKAEEKQKQM
jgi:hypothetical protein